MSNPIPPQIIKSFLTKNDCYKAGRIISVKGLMLHSVGCSQPSANAFLKSWNQPGVSACVHAFIDANTGIVYQTLPWNYQGWHCGGTGNNNYIGVELCEPQSIEYTHGAAFIDHSPSNTSAAVDRTYQAAVTLFAYLCSQYHLDPGKDGVILSHREGHRRGIATNHGDPEHLWTPFGQTMNAFRRDVQAALSPIAQTASHRIPYQVIVVPDSLNIRSGPGTNYSVVGQIKHGEVYTITQESHGKGASRWGKLKSGAGWLSLDFTNAKTEH